MPRLTRLALLIALVATPTAAQDARPNILWITSEDNGPQLGAYGDGYAVTPNLDGLARRGVRYLHAWSNAPVCAPARTAIISGMYPSSTGAEHMRSLVRLPGAMRMFPALLREAGYYTSNNEKEDYNLVKTPEVWDDSSRTAHWRNRKAGQPFFAVFNITDSHESQVHRKPAPKVHDPAMVRVPAYHPDIPEVRADWAAYYDNLTVMDRKAGERLAELDADGLAGDTIVVYFGDHGPGMPRSKRWPYNSGLQVPLLVHVPPKFRHLAPDGYDEGAALSRLVAFVDLAPTMLSVAGVKPPDWMQGHAFMGRFATKGPQYAFGLRGRMDERYDMVRSVTDGRFVYVRNYMPHRTYGQYLEYMFRMPMVKAWKRLYDAGRLSPPKTLFWEPKPAEELYDLRADPDEVDNLAASAAHRQTIERFRRALEEHAREIRDVGFVPEYALHREQARGQVPYDFGHDEARCDLERIRAAAQRATDSAVPLAAIRPALAEADPSIRYWAATGVLVRGREAVAAVEPDLVRLLADDAPGPRIVAGEALARHGTQDARRKAIATLLDLADAGSNEEYVAMLALNALNLLPDLPAESKAAVLSMPTAPAKTDQRENYVVRLIEAIRQDAR
jgi:uncharacterized sulfatase